MDDSREQIFAWKREQRRARTRYAALEMAVSHRLKAEAELRSAAANAVQQHWPLDRDQVEHVLYPALETYARTLFDRIAEARLREFQPNSSLRLYIHWLRCTCIKAVVEDTCAGTRLYDTAKHALEVIGENRWPPQVDQTRRALAGVMTELLGGPHVRDIENRLSAVLAVRVAFWEAAAIEKGSGFPPVNLRATAGMVLGGSREKREPAQAHSAGMQEEGDEGVARTEIQLTRRRGPQPDLETALQVAAIVTQIASTGDWRSKLEEICDLLDDKRIKRPKPWREKGLSSWTACLAGERELAVKAIEYHLKQAAKHTPETFS